MADFASDEVYDLEDEGGFAMGQAGRESRRRVQTICEGRKLADNPTLVVDDLIRELQTFLTRFVRAHENLQNPNGLQTIAHHQTRWLVVKRRDELSQ